MHVIRSTGLFHIFIKFIAYSYTCGDATFSCLAKIFFRVHKFDTLIIFKL